MKMERDRQRHGEKQPLKVGVEIGEVCLQAKRIQGLPKAKRNK